MSGREGFKAHENGRGPCGPMIPTMYRVVSSFDEDAETVTLTIEPVDSAIPDPRPGQFNMLWAFGVGEAPISLAGLEGERLVHTIRRVGAVTRGLCKLAAGDPVGVRGPFGNGWPLDRAKGRDVLVVAGGLGLAPVRPLVEEALAGRIDIGRLSVLIGARSPDALIYRRELEGWLSHPGIDLDVTVDTAPASWRGNVGLVTQLMDRAQLDMADAVLFACGPEIMMRFTALAFIRLEGSATDAFISLERNMQCAIGHCGHCQLGPVMLCTNGPVMDWATAEPLLAVRSL